MVPYDLYEGALRMDGPTLQNLDLLETREGSLQGSLLSYLDSCASAGAVIRCISGKHQRRKTGPFLACRACKLVSSESTSARGLRLQNLVSRS